MHLVAILARPQSLTIASSRSSMKTLEACDIITRCVTSRYSVAPTDLASQLHFFCGNCGTPFLDPSQSSAAGTEHLREAGSGENELTQEYVVHGSHAYCGPCHLKLHSPRCRACKKPVTEDGIVAMGSSYHRDCWTCSVRARTSLGLRHTDCALCRHAHERFVTPISQTRDARCVSNASKSKHCSASTCIALSADCRKMPLPLDDDLR